MNETQHDVDVDLDDKEKKQIVINAAGGSHVTVNINVRNYEYPEWLENIVQEKISWEEAHD